MRPPTSLARHADRSDAGFTLLEVLCVVSILAMLMAVALPALPRGTSRAKLESYALAAATLLQADRSVASRGLVSVATEVDAKSRTIRSNVTNRIVRVPPDVAFDTLLPTRCAGYPAHSAIRFFPSGMSCGGVIALTREAVGFEVRVNWLTGGIDVVPRSRT